MNCIFSQAHTHTHKHTMRGAYRRLILILYTYNENTNKGKINKKGHSIYAFVGFFVVGFFKGKIQLKLNNFKSIKIIQQTKGDYQLPAGCSNRHIGPKIISKNEMEFQRILLCPSIFPFQIYAIPLLHHYFHCKKCLLLLTFLQIYFAVSARGSILITATPIPLNFNITYSVYTIG